MVMKAYEEINVILFLEVPFFWTSDIDREDKYENTSTYFEI